MKTPNIEIYHNNNIYYILFGIQDRIEFPNKTIAKSYVYDLKKLIRDTMYLLSNLQGIVYSSYSNNYFHLDYKTNHNLKKSFLHFEKQRDLVFENFSSGNGSFVFTSIDKCFDALDSSILYLKEFAQISKQFALKNQMYALIRHLEVINKTYYSDKKKLNIDFSIRNKKIKVIHLKYSENAV